MINKGLMGIIQDLQNWFHEGYRSSLFISKLGFKKQFKTYLKQISCSIESTLDYKGLHSTCWDGEDQKARSTPENHEAHLTQPPPQTFVQNETGQDGRNFHEAKDKLREVDVHAKAANIQAQPVVQQAR